MHGLRCSSYLFSFLSVLAFQVVSFSIQPPRQVESTDVHALFDSLFDGFDEWQSYAQSTALQPSPIGQPSVPMKAVLSDGRVSRLRELLNEMPKREAEAELRRVFGFYLTKLSRVYSSVEDPAITVFEAQFYKSGLHSLLFLAAHSVSTEFADELAQDWIKEYLSGIDQKGTAYERDASPDALFLINLYAQILAKSDATANLTREQLTASLNQKLVDLGSTTRFSQLPGISYDKLIFGDAEYPLIIGWGRAIEIAGNADSKYRSVRLKVLTHARSIAFESESWMDSIANIIAGNIELVRLLDMAERTQAAQKLKSEALKALVGKWQAIKVIDDGEPLDDDAVEGMRLEFTREKLIMTGFEDVVEAREFKFRIDATTDPKQLDILVDAARLKGIFKIDDEGQLHWVREGTDHKRPTDFDENPPAGTWSGLFEQEAD